MKLLFENWRGYLSEGVEVSEEVIRASILSLFPHAKIGGMELIGSSALSPEARIKQDIEKYVKTDKYDMDIIQQRKEADALKGIDSNSIGKSDDDHVGYTIPGDNDDDNDDS